MTTFLLVLLSFLFLYIMPTLGWSYSGPSCSHLTGVRHLPASCGNKNSSLKADLQLTVFKASCLPPHLDISFLHTFINEQMLSAPLHA